ncbi:hypothetical protein AM587_10002892 [Phytophthora nicotianae]|uniref:Uncharacterized protein n=1 Tax=Phytophthora nicotianae TaxID=4792 RepID=A0A0W8BXX5_PHYNI|nr:hypothetical protein AM587_10002892 [Phytophthora nicotianae]
MKVRLSATLLFHLEYRALVGYTEAVIPLLYAVYLSILFHLPSAKYYPHSRSLTPDQLQTTAGSIVAMQLAFALETEMEQLHGRLFVWIIILLQLPLVHFGMDFSFQFEWMNSQSIDA